MSAYDFILICAGKRTTMQIIAQDSQRATCIGIRSIPRGSRQVRITCKPARQA